ncbi:MAG: DUF4424 family protein [Methylocystis sp.]|jgi:hypothetical protein
MRKSPSLLMIVAASLAPLAPVVVQAKERAPTPPATEASQGDSNEPTPAVLVVGPLQIASDANLAVEGTRVSVAVDNVAYTYQLKNKGQTELDLFASIAMPVLAASVDGSETWALPSSNAENPVDLVVTADGAKIATKVGMHANALSVDRLAEIRAARLPLVPFGPEIDRAVAALTPDAADKLAALGVLSPRDPTQASAAITADWTLEAVHSWQQRLEPGKTTALTVSFKPVKAEYTLDKSGVAGLDALKDDACLSSQTLNTIKSKLRAKNGALSLVDIALSNDAPVRWLESPSAVVSVQKPVPETIVAFCGIDPKTVGQPRVVGTIPSAEQSEGFRVLMFSPMTP